MCAVGLAGSAHRPEVTSRAGGSTAQTRLAQFAGAVALWMEMDDVADFGAAPCRHTQRSQRRTSDRRQPPSANPGAARISQLKRLTELIGLSPWRIENYPRGAGDMAAV